MEFCSRADAGGTYRDSAPSKFRVEPDSAKRFVRSDYLPIKGIDLKLNRKRMMTAIDALNQTDCNSGIPCNLVTNPRRKG